MIFARQTRRLMLAGVAVAALALPLAGSPAYAAAGDVLTFGGDSFGQLGNGDAGATHIPTRVLGGASDVAGGREHTLALAGGSVYAWGADTKGAVGDGGATTSNVVTPKPLGSMTGVDSVTTGHYHSMALDKGTSTVWAWGWNSRGQIGPAGGTSLKVAAPVKVAFPATAGAVTMIAAGRAHSLAVAGGRVYTWGHNLNGQLGLGGSDDSRHPTPTLVPNLSGVVWVAGGRDSSFAITTTGQLYAWGSDNYGQLGNGTAVGSTASPKLIAGTWKQVESGADHTIGLRANGAVASWGRNRYGQLGRNGTANAQAPVDVPGLAAGIAEVRVGRDHSMAFGAGKFFTWGRNDGGQLGVSPTTTPQRYTPALVPALAGAHDAGGGQVHTVAALG